MAAKHTGDVELEDFRCYSDLAEEPLVIYAPINGYEQMPLVSLEEAIQPLVSLVPDVREMLRQVKEHCSEMKDGLTSNESASIMLYSMEWTPRENSFSRILNKALRHEDREGLKPWYPYLKLFMKALSKLPSINCYVYRGVQGDFSDEYVQGKTFVWWSFALCARSIDILEKEPHYGRARQRTRFKIECKSGKDIRQHSFGPLDNEILLLSAQRYKVIASFDSDHDLRIIQVKEIDPNSVAAPSVTDRTSSLSLSLTQRKASINISMRDTSFCSVVLRLTVRVDR